MSLFDIILLVLIVGLLATSFRGYYPYVGTAQPAQPRVITPVHSWVWIIIVILVIVLLLQLTGVLAHGHIIL